MKIEIEKCTKREPYSWYENKIGEQFEVVAINRLNKKSKEYIVKTEDGEQKPVLQQDCRILWETMNFQ